MKLRLLFSFLLLLLVCGAGFASGIREERQAENVISAQENDVTKYFNLASSEYNAGNFEKAIEYFSKIIEIAPNIYSAYINRASAYRIIRDYDNAINDLAYVIENNKDNTNYVNAYSNLGNVYLLMREYDKAIEVLLLAVNIKEDFPEALSSIGAAYYSKGELDKAIEYYTRAIFYKNDYPGAYNNRGLAFFYRGNNELALNDYLSALKYNPNLGEAYNNIGLINQAEGNNAEAIANYTKAIDLNYREALVYNNRGNAYKSLGDNERAIADYTTAISIDNNFAFAYNNRGIAHKNTGNYEEAVYDYVKAIEIMENYTDAWNNLGNLFFTFGDNEQAYEIYLLSLYSAYNDININSIINQALHFINRIYGESPYLEGINFNDDNFLNTLVLLSMTGIELCIEKTEDARNIFGSRGERIFERRLPVYYAGVDLEAASGNLEKAFFYSESLRSRSFLEQIGNEAASRLPGISEEDSLKLQELNNRINSLRNILDSYENKLPDYAYAEAGRRLSEAEEERNELDLKLKEVPRYTELRNPVPVELQEAMEWCGENRAILEYVIWEESIYKPVNTGSELLSIPPSINSYCLIITKNDIIPVRLSPDSEFNYAGMVNALRGKLYYKDRYGGIYPNNETVFEDERNALYNALIKPVLKHLPENINSLLIIPDSNLAFLPFDMLRVNNLPETRCLGDDYEISLSPSISCSIMAKRNGVAHNEPVIAFGGVWYARDENTNRPDDYEITEIDNSLAELERRLSYYRGNAGSSLQERIKAQDYFDYIRRGWIYLPGTVEEIQGLKKIAVIDPQIYEGKIVSEHLIKELSDNGTLMKYPIVHFACHGFYDDNLIPQAALVFSEVSGLIKDESEEDGYLSIEEIALLQLNAKIVMLSACQTGLGEIKRGDGINGLARAFMAAGTQNVGVSLWEISDEATSAFMWSVYSKVIREGKTFRKAYHETKSEFRNGDIAHPFYWAAFALYE